MSFRRSKGSSVPSDSLCLLFGGIRGGEGGASGKVGCVAFLRAFAMVETG
jgi:hypothetical protein